MNLRVWAFPLTVIFMLVLTTTLRAQYDPLAIGNTNKKAKDPLDMTVKDEKRSRDIPIRVYLPDGDKPAPVVLFSHGLGGSRENNPYLGKHWSARGYVVVFTQHAGSDAVLWKDQPLGKRMAALKGAANVENFELRNADVSAVLDQLEKWNTTEKHPLAGRLDLKHVGMSGHSFGAVTTQAVSGQTFPLGKSYADARIKAAVMMSPSVPKRGDPAKAFGEVKLPWLLLTGTNDNSPINDTDAASRQRVYPALPAGTKYELVLDKAEHSAFGDRALPGESEKRNPNHHRAVLALTTAFWDAYLRDDADARKWLDGDGPKSVLEKEDRWQRK